MYVLLADSKPHSRPPLEGKRSVLLCQRLVDVSVLDHSLSVL